MSLLLKLLTAEPLKNYRTQVLGLVVMLTALAHWLVGDMGFIAFLKDLPTMVTGLGLSALGAKVNGVKKAAATAQNSDKTASSAKQAS